jgi:hypothetical protein
MLTLNQGLHHQPKVTAKGLLWLQTMEEQIPIAQPGRVYRPGMDIIDGRRVSQNKALIVTTDAVLLQ